MAVWSWLLLALALVGVQGQSNRTISQADIDTILSLHNSLRSKIAPVATDMFRITWDASLANSAQNYANSCPTAHSGWPNLGENLSWGWPSMTAADAVKEWINEGPNYSFDANICAPGKVCAHYTQMIWGSTTKIGCGVRSCQNILGQPVTDAWVCHYTIAGNIVGSKPYTPGATSCSACPSSTVCMENLCTIPGTSVTPAVQGGTPSSTPSVAGTPSTPSAQLPTPAIAGVATPATADYARVAPISAAGVPVAGLGMPASVGAGLGMPASVGAGLGMPASVGAGLGMPASVGAGLGVPASSGAAMGIPVSSGAAMPSSAVAAPSALAPSAAMPLTPAVSPSVGGPAPIPIGVIQDSPSMSGLPLSPFTVVQSTNKTAIVITESSNSTVSNITSPDNGTVTIVGFPHRVFFG